MAAALNNPLARARRVVVKVGSSLLVDEEGALRREWLASLSADIAELRAAEVDVVLVSSGAIALGRAPLGLGNGELRLEDSQAAAATGQIRLAHAWQAALEEHALTVALILLTSDDTEVRRRYLNARNTFAALLARGAVPVVNENDTVATDEIRFGDNDRLAARVAAMLGADCLILLSDVDGLYTGDPRRNADVRLLDRLTRITPEIEAMAGDEGTGLSRGGMKTKLKAARIALQAGCSMAIANGRALNPLARIADGGRATWFLAEANPANARKRWIAGTLKPLGTVRIDDGAVAALAAGRSLLPIGATAIEGDFERGDAVIVADGAGRELARGLSAWASDDARRIIGRRSEEIASLLGYAGRAELVHRDDLVLTGLETPDWQDAEAARPQREDAES